MKKILAMLLVLAMALSMVACGGNEAGKDGGYKVAMVTDYGDITDQSFNQTTYEACKAFCEGNSIEFTYYKPAGDSDAERVAMIEKAVDEVICILRSIRLRTARQLEEADRVNRLFMELDLKTEQ